MKDNNQTVFVSARVFAKPEFVEKVKAACLALVNPSRAEAGCISYNLFQSTDTPNLFIFFEEWGTREDLENHLNTPHAAQFDKITDGLLLEDEEIIYLNQIV